ncbi:hypothetical protein [Sporomusa sp.]|uniref:hypothetical protein n=1 Tax=Sporomusa sp. TaxID=2078658 RepID=UPI002B6CBB42|nr:hypothetical protein [Sporomusa sp.]HWR05649.1 hypothetical protein [Sporomusa sp.]
MATKKSAFWNGKNFAGESQTGSQSLIAEGPRTNSTQAKYEVSNETISAADLQPSAKTTENITNKHG